LVLTQTVVCSPDTVAGNLRAADADGIDSVWITVDQSEEAVDGRLEREFETTFRLPVRAGLDAGTPVAILARARDVAGFTDTVRQSLPVVLCALQRLN